MKLQKVRYTDFDKEQSKDVRYMYAHVTPFENDHVRDVLINLDRKTWKTISDEDLLEIGKTVFNLFYDDNKLRLKKLVESGIELDNVFYYTTSILREDGVILVDVKILNDEEKAVFINEYIPLKNNLN